MNKTLTKLILSTVVLLCTLGVQAQEIDSLYVDSTDNEFSTVHMLDSVFKHVDLLQVPTGILIDKALLTANITDFNGTLHDSNVCSAFLWRRLWASLHRAHVDTAISKDTTELYNLVDTLRGYLNAGIVPITLLNYQYSRIKENAFENNLFYMEGIQLFDEPLREENPYENANCFAAAAATNESDSLTVHFIVPSLAYFTNDTYSIDTLQIDFGDGLGYRTVGFDEEIIIVYDTAVEVQLSVRVVTTAPQVHESHFTFELFGSGGSSSSPANDYYTVIGSKKIYPEEPEPGSDGKGIAYVSIHYQCGNSQKVLRRPFIVVGGYDVPRNNFGSPYYKGPKYGKGYLELIEDQSDITYWEIVNQEYDLVFVEFARPADYIQRNAYALEEVIKWVNEVKALNGSTAPNVIMGHSMGGIVSRYALGELHAEHLANPTTEPDHDTRLLYTHDSPHLGVNIPVGTQVMVKMMYEYYITINNLAFVELEDLSWSQQNLKSRSGRQMLIHDINAPYAPNPHSEFYDELNTVAPLDALGCKAVLICDGSGAGIPQGTGVFGSGGWNPTNAGDYIARFNKYLGRGVNFSMDVYATPDGTGSLRVFEGGYFNAINNHYYKRYSVKADAYASMFTSLDGAPGSFMVGSTIGLAGGLANPLSDYVVEGFRYIPVCFIPSISSAGYSGLYSSNKYYTTINGYAVPSNYKFYLTRDDMGGTLPSDVVSLRNGVHGAFTPHSAELLNNDWLKMVPETLSTGDWFNYGPPVSDRIGTTLVEDGATLYINSDLDVGLYDDDIRYTVNPKASSTYRVETKQLNVCTFQSSTITLEGDLVLGDISNNLSGELIVRTGSKLKLENSSEVKLYKQSKIIIQEGAELVVDGNVNIELDGENSEIIIRGKLTVKDNTTLNVTGAGSIHFDCPENAYCNTDISPGSTINLIGNGRSVKMLKVTGKGINLTNLEELNITTAKVELGTNSEVVIGGSLELNAVRVSKTTGTAGNHIHKGFEINSPTGKTIAIDNCIFEYGIKGLTKTASSSLTQLVVENTTFTNCSLGLKTNECRCNLVNVRFDNCVTGWKAEAMSGSSDFRGYVQSVDNGIDYEGGSTAHLFIYESTFKTCNNSNTSQAILADGDFNATISCTHFEDNENDIKKIDGVLNLSGSEYSENRFASSPEVGGSCYFNNTLRYTIDLSNVDFYIYDGNNDFDYPDETPNEVFNGTITSNTTTLALGGNHWKFDNFTPPDNVDLPLDLFNIASTATPKFETATKLSSPSNCLSAWNGVQEYVERIHKPGKSALNKEISSYIIYPNPAANQLFIKVSNGSLSANQRVKAIDMMGRTITLNALSQDSSTQSYDISQLAVGMYQIIVEQNGHILHKQKLVVSR